MPPLRELAAGPPYAAPAHPLLPKPAPIGITGPQWIQKELVFERVGGPIDDDGGVSSHIAVQSWMFVVGPGPIDTKYLPTGMHYCKLLSPARAMEWIYTDGLRARLGA